MKDPTNVKYVSKILLAS